MCGYFILLLLAVELFGGYLGDSSSVDSGQ